MVAAAALPLVLPARVRQDEQAVAQMSADAANLLKLAQAYSDSYVSNLPNLICVQTTEQFQSDSKGRHWRQGDTYSSRLVFVDGKEKRTLLSVNGKPLSELLRARSVRVTRRPLTTEGEFGPVIANVLGSDALATWTWAGWEGEGAARVAVFNYNIDLEHSTRELSLSDLAKARIAYHGQVRINAANGEVRQISSETTEVPAELRTTLIQDQIIYAPVAIGGRTHVVPVRATVVANTFTSRIRNEMTFTNYQQFEASSTIQFGDDSEPSPPKP